MKDLQEHPGQLNSTLFVFPVQYKQKAESLQKNRVRNLQQPSL